MTTEDRREHDKDIQKVLEVVSEHVKDDAMTQKRNIEDIQEIKSDIKTIKENHLAHIQVSMGKMEIDIDWIKRFFWLVAASSIAGLGTGILNLILK